MQYRAAIFDIDGTLVHKGEKAPSAALQNAIMRLQAQGVTVIIATGRAHFSARAVAGIAGGTRAHPGRPACPRRRCRPGPHARTLHQRAGSGRLSDIRYSERSEE